MMLELHRFLKVHVSRIPLVGKGGNGVESPMHEDAKLPILVPARNLVLPQRGPGGAEGAGSDCVADRSLCFFDLHGRHPFLSPGPRRGDLIGIQSSFHTAGRATRGWRGQRATPYSSTIMACP